MAFFFNDTSTSEIYTLSLHDALPIYSVSYAGLRRVSIHLRRALFENDGLPEAQTSIDRKSTRLNSSHSSISYAVFCLKKKTRFALFLGLHEPRHLLHKLEASVSIHYL